MIKLITLAILLISSNVCLSDDVKTYDGIWQNTANERSYYSIQTKDQQVVLIDLSAIESTGNTLGSAYIGSNVNGSIRMSRVSSPAEGISRILTFQLANEGTIVPGCAIYNVTSGAICDVTPITIRKIF